MKKTLSLIFSVIFLSIILIPLSSCASNKADVDVSAQIEEGNSYIESESYKEAADAFKKAIKSNPRSADAYHGLISSYTKDAEANEGTDHSAELFEAYEKLYELRDCNAEELLALSKIYKQKGKLLEYRDLAEQSLRMSPSEEALAEVNSIVVSTDSDSKEIQSTAKTLCETLEKEDINSSFEILFDDDWYSVMAPSLSAGHRRYTAKDSSGSELKIETGIGNGSVRYNKIWFENDDKLTYIKTTPTQILHVVTTIQNGKYNGAYSSRLCDSSSGAVYLDSGTFTDNILTGSISSSVGSVSSEEGLVSMYAAMDSAVMSVYTGTFDEAGHTTAPQQSYITSQGGVIYAYNADSTKFLYVYGLNSEAGSGYVFDSSSFAVDFYPEW